MTKKTPASAFNLVPRWDADIRRRKPKSYTEVRRAWKKAGKSVRTGYNKDAARRYNPPSRAAREAHQKWAAAANAKARQEEAEAHEALGRSRFTWRGYGTRGTRFLQAIDDLVGEEKRELLKYIKIGPASVSLDMPPNASADAKYGAHAAFSGLGDHFTDYWKARNTFDNWVSATPGGWDE